MLISNLYAILMLTYLLGGFVEENKVPGKKRVPTVYELFDLTSVRRRGDHNMYSGLYSIPRFIRTQALKVTHFYLSRHEARQKAVLLLILISCF